MTGTSDNGDDVFEFYEVIEWHFFPVICMDQPISAQCCISYRNQSFDLHSKSNDWCLYEMLHWADMG